MTTTERLIESIGGRYTFNYGHPRVRIAKGPHVHSIPACEEGEHKISKKCPCRPEVHIRPGGPIFFDHPHIGQVPPRLPARENPLFKAWTPRRGRR